MKIKKIEKPEETVEISKLPIGRYSELLTIIKKILATTGVAKDLVNLTDVEFVAKIPELVVQNMPDALEIVRIGTGLPKEKIAAFGLDEIVDLIIGIVEVNKYSEVYEKIKKGLAQLPKQDRIVKPTGSPVPSTS